jgi:hypothetical protein
MVDETLVRAVGLEGIEAIRFAPLREIRRYRVGLLLGPARMAHPFSAGLLDQTIADARHRDEHGKEQQGHKHRQQLAAQHDTMARHNARASIACWLFDISQVRGRVKDGLAVLRAKRANINIG